MLDVPIFGHEPNLAHQIMAATFHSPHRAGKGRSMPTRHSTQFQPSGIVITAVDTYLRTLRLTIPHLIGSMVSTPDGLQITEDLPGYLEPTAVAALAATQTSLAQRFTANTYGADLSEVVIRCGVGYVVIYPVGESGTLTILTSEAADVGRIHREAQPVVFNLTQLLMHSPIEISYPP